MPLIDLLRRRRSIKKFTERPVTRAEIETLLEAAVLAPNHRLTEPWRFYVLGPDAREAYGHALGVRKARKIEDPEASRTMRDRVAAEHRALPCMIAIALVKSDNPEIAEEDYASAMMAVQNIMLAAVELGLGAAIRTGGVMGDDAARAAAGVAENERIVANEIAKRPFGGLRDANARRDDDVGVGHGGPFPDHDRSAAQRAAAHRSDDSHREAELARTVGEVAVALHLGATPTHELQSLGG